MKRILTLLLSVLLLIGLMPMQGAVVFASDGENLAFDKPVTVLGNREGYNPQALTDGNLSNAWAGTSIDSNWAMVDLEEAYVIDSVVLHTYKGENTAHFRRNMNVQFSNTPDFSVCETVVAVRDVAPEFGAAITVAAPSKTPYRYVRMLKTLNTTPALAEIEVYGRAIKEGLIVGTDAIGTKYEGPATLMAYLGLMEAEDNINELFGVGTVLTRGEAAEAVVRAFSGNASFTGGIPFVDVPTSHPCYTAITTACHLGYVTGDDGSYFRPNEFITKTEFAFMVLRAIGYDDVIEKVMKNDPGHVINLSEELDLFKNVGGNGYTDPVTRGDAAVVFYNAFLSPKLNMFASEGDYLVFDEEEDLLRRKYGIVLTQGIVEENTISTLNGNVKESKSSVKIGGRAYRDPNGLLNSYLGRTVVVATEQNGSGTILLAWPVLTDEEITLAADKLTSTEADIKAGKIVALDESDRKESFDLDNNYYVVKNGIALPYAKPADLIIKQGQLRLLDNDRDGLYEVVFVDAYSLHYLNNAFYDDFELTVLDSDDVSTTLEREGLTIVNGAGSSLGIKKVTKGSVVKWFDGGEFNKLVVYNEPVVGKITEYSDKTAAVEGATYPLSLPFKELNKTFTPGDMVSMFVDENGEVLWIQADEEAMNKEWIIAFSQKYIIGTGLNSQVGFRMFTESGKWVELYVADRISVNGTTMDKSDFATALKGTAKGVYTGALLRYKVNASGLINAMDTASDEVDFCYEGKVESAIYAADTNAFWSGNTMLLPAKKTTKTFRIPIIKGEPVSDSSYDYLFSVVELRTQTPSSSEGMTAQNLHYYMLDENGYPTCFVKYIDAPVMSGSSEILSAVEERTSPFMLVESVYRTAIEGGVAIQVNGRSITSSGLGGSTSFLVDENLTMIETGKLYQAEKEVREKFLMTPSSGKTSEYSKYDMVDTLALNELPAEYKSSVSDIGFGDIVRYQSSSPTVKAVERVFKLDKTVPSFGTENQVWYAVNGHTGVITGHNRFQLGKLVNVDDTVFTIETQVLKEGSTTEYVKETYLKESFATVLACVNVSGKTSLKKVSDLAQYGGKDNVQLMLYSYNGQPKAIIIYPY